MNLLKLTFGQSGPVRASARAAAPRTKLADRSVVSAPETPMQTKHIGFAMPKLAGAVTTAALVLALGLTTATPSTAVSTKSRIAERGASERVAFSDKLRMYSQRMTASACTEFAGVAPQYSAGFLAVSAREFDRIVNALENGDKALGIVGAEDNRKTLELIKGLRAQWDPMRAIVDTILTDGANRDLTLELEQRNAKLMEYSATVVGVISGQYSDPTALLQSDAIRLGIAGRQRMLSQKLSNEACMIQIGAADADRTAAFKGTIEQFDISLRALRQGMPAAGIYPSDKPAIQAGLDAVASHWNDLKFPLEALTQGASWTDETQANVYNSLNELMFEMNKVVILYTKDSKLSL